MFTIYVRLPLDLNIMLAALRPEHWDTYIIAFECACVAHWKPSGWIGGVDTSRCKGFKHESFDNHVALIDRR